MKNLLGKPTTRKIAYSALLIALNMVLVRLLSISMGSFRVNLGFVAIAILSTIVPPLLCGLCAAVADTLGFFLFSSGPYLPGITVCAFMYGFLFGLFYYKKNINIKSILISNTLGIILIDLFLKSFFLYIYQLYALNVLIITRPIQCAIMLPVQISVIYFLKKYFIEKNKLLLDTEKL
jgi:ECF transporter S component (folate family)